MCTAVVTGLQCEVRRKWVPGTAAAAEDVAGLMPPFTCDRQKGGRVRVCTGRQTEQGEEGCDDGFMAAATEFC